MRRHFCLSVMLSTKSTNFGSRYHAQRRKNGTKFGTLINRALLYMSSKIGELWPKWFPGGVKIHKWVKKTVTRFWYIMRNEIWHDDGHWSAAGPKRFW